MAEQRTFILSEETLNNKGFIVVTAGIELGSFKKNPVMLFNHDTDKLIGRWANVRKEDDRLMADPEFDADDEFAVKQEKRVQNGFLKAASVWLHPLKVEMSNDDDPPRLTKSILMEASIVPVPSNHGAVMLCDEHGKPLKAEDVEKTIQKLAADTSDADLDKSKPKPKMKEFKLSAENMVKLNLKDGFQEEDLNTAINKLAADKAAAETKATTAETQLNEFKTSRKKTMLDAAQAAGKFKAEDRKEWEDLADANIELCAKQLERIPGAQKPSDVIKLGADGGDGSGVKNEDRKDWDYKKWSKEDPKGLQLMAKVNKDEYTKLREAYIKANQ